MITASKIAGIAGMFGGLGYFAYNYFVPQTMPAVSPSVATPLSVPSVSVMQARMVPTPSITSAVAPLMASAGNTIMDQGMHQWIAGNSINPWM